MGSACFPRLPSRPREEAPDHPEQGGQDHPEAAATVVIAWRRGLRPVVDLDAGQPYVFEEVEALLGMPVTAGPRSKLRDRALREETTAAMDIVFAGSIARRVFTGEAMTGPGDLRRAATLAKRIASGREVQKLVADAIDRVESELRDDDVHAVVIDLVEPLRGAGSLERGQVKAIPRDRVRPRWAWWRNLSRSGAPDHWRSALSELLVALEALEPPGAKVVIDPQDRLALDLFSNAQLDSASSGCVVRYGVPSPVRRD